MTDLVGTLIKVEANGEETKLSIGSHSAFLGEKEAVELIEKLLVELRRGSKQ